MGDLATWATELAVGVVTMGFGAAIWKRSGPPRVVALLMVVAGVVAVVHAISRTL